MFTCGTTTLFVVLPAGISGMGFMFLGLIVLFFLGRQIEQIGLTPVDVASDDTCHTRVYFD